MKNFGVFALFFAVNLIANFTSACEASENVTQFPSPSVRIPNSPALLKDLAFKEEQVYQLLSKYNSPCYTKPSGTAQLLTEYLSLFENTTGQLRYENYNVPSRAKAVAWNPLASFHMIKRVVRTLRPLVASLNGSSSESKIQQEILEIVDSTWPTESDLKEICSAILRLQHTFDLPTVDIANGILDEEVTGLSLCQSDCNDLGRTAVADGYYYLAIEWFDEGLRRPCPTDPLVSELLYNNADLVAAAHDAIHKVSEEWDPVLFATKQRAQPGASKLRRRTREFNLWKGSHGLNFNEIKYWGLCSGENYQNQTQASQLFCWYETKIHPYWAINPLKAELLSAHSLILIQYHDIISKKKIKKIQNVATSRLARSNVFIGPGKEEISPVRTSVNTFVHDVEDPAIKEISRTVEFITGLKLLGYEAAEALQVASYSPGGHYLVHRDPLEVERPGGDRIATFLFYLSDVLKGGGTAFPMAGVASKPIKGSAVFWYNLHRSGVSDEYAYHGACPVILGEKWIGNKWVKVDAQMFSQDSKCLPDAGARPEFRVNGKPLSSIMH